MVPFILAFGLHCSNMICALTSLMMPQNNYTHSQRKRNILEVAFLLEKSVYKKTYMQMSHDPGSHDPDPGLHEKSMTKSCVSFETECRLMCICYYDWLCQRRDPHSNESHLVEIIIAAYMWYHICLTHVVLHKRQQGSGGTYFPTTATWFSLSWNIFKPFNLEGYMD